MLVADGSNGAAAIGLLIFAGWAAVMWVFPTWICVSRGKQRGRNGWLWGLILGWLGVIMIFALPSKAKEVE